MEEPKFELRRLKADDLFPMAAILKKIGLKEIKKNLDPAVVGKLITTLKDKGAPAEDLTYTVGVSVTLEIVEIVIGNLPACKKDVYMLLSQVSGIPEKKIGELDLPVFMEMIVAFVRKEEFKDFFSAASKLLK